MAGAAQAKGDVEYSIKPETVTPAIPTSEWPLLLKNYDKRAFLSLSTIFYSITALLYGVSFESHLTVVEPLQYSCEPVILRLFPTAALP